MSEKEGKRARFAAKFKQALAPQGQKSGRVTDISANLIQESQSRPNYGPRDPHQSRRTVTPTGLDISHVVAPGLPVNLGHSTPRAKYVSTSLNPAVVEPPVNSSFCADVPTTTQKIQSIVSSADQYPNTPHEFRRPLDLWDQAYKRLSDENRSLVEKYEQILTLEENEEGNDSGVGNLMNSNGIGHSRDRLTALASKKLARLDESRLKVRLGKHEIVLKEGLDQILTVVMATKDFVSSAVSAEPHAALAWTGVCLLLPFLLNPTIQYERAVIGLLEIPLVIRRYEVLEVVYRNGQYGRKQLKEDFEDRVIKLYATILQYQARAVCQWSRNPVHQYVRDALIFDGWSTLYSNIQSLDSSCKDIAQALDAGAWETTLKKQNDKLQHMLSGWYDEQREIIVNLREETNKALEINEAQRQAEQSRGEKQEERSCHQAFGPSNYVEHKNLNPPRVSKTCNWFLNHQRFINWQQRDSSSLIWVSADPGCGKSVLVKSLVDEGLIARGSEVSSICYFFFRDGLEEQQGAARCVSALLHQLFQQKPSLVKYALPDFRKDGPNISKSFHTTWNILKEAATDLSAGEIICLLDALDECEETSRYVLIDALKQLYTDHGHQNRKLKFLVTARPYEDIKRRFRSLTNKFPHIKLQGEEESEAISQEISLVIKMRVPEIAIELELSPEVETGLLNSLLSIPNRTYLWLHLTLEEILKSKGASTIKRLGVIVTDLPKTIDAAYDKILKRVADPVLCRRLLHIVLAALRPLSLSEVNIALNIKEDTHTIIDLDMEDETHFANTVRDLCGLFVSVIDKRLFLIHQTAREFLVRHETCSGHQSSWKHSFLPNDSHLILARSCILYLQFREFRFERSNGWAHFVKFQSDERDTIHAFLTYASCSWTSHYNEKDPDIVAKDGAARLCDPHSRHFLTWIQILVSESTDWVMNPADLSNLTKLMVASYLGFQQMARQEIKKGSDVNESTEEGLTPLMIAARSEQNPTVQMLIASGAKLHMKTGDNYQAIHFAARENHVEALSILLDNGAYQNAESDDGTPLNIAVENGHMGIVHRLVQRNDVETDATSPPIIIAARNHSKEMVDLLHVYGVRVQLQKLGSEESYKYDDQDPNFDSNSDASSMYESFTSAVST